MEDISPKSDAATMPSSKRRILLVEDDTFISDIYQTKLDLEGFEVIAAMNGLDAIKELESGIVPDLVLLDIIMPYMDGMEVLRAIKAKPEWQKIPIILLTNLSNREQIDECLQLGANDYLIKSHFTPTEVTKKINALIGGNPA